MRARFVTLAALVTTLAAPAQAATQNHGVTTDHFATDMIRSNRSFTMMGRFRFARFSATAPDFNSIFNFFRSGAENHFTFVDQNGVLGVVRVDSPAKLVAIDTGSTLALDTNYHIAVTYNEATGVTNVYLNGVLDATISAQTNADDISFFGRLTDGMFEGIKIWVGAALSQAEVQSEIASLSAVRTANLYDTWDVSDNSWPTAGNANGFMMYSLAASPAYVEDDLPIAVSNSNEQKQ